MTSSDATEGGPTRPSLQALLEGDVVTSLDICGDLWADLRDTVEVLVVKARQEGYSWDVIARCLGITRQAAWARFHRSAIAEGGQVPARKPP